MTVGTLTDKTEGLVDWYPFLSRQRLPSPDPEKLICLRGKSVLVTGAGGSIGSELCLRLATLNLNKLVLLEASEQALFRLEARMHREAMHAGATAYLGSVLDETLLQEILSTHKFQLVFHAAAYKHVPLLEQHPLAAIQNNIFGTLSLVECAARHGFPKLILLSTDKAADPASILGATKRIAEQITLAAGGLALRLANVLGSEGSVVESFLDSIQKGEPVTITAPDAERFFLTQEEAVDLLLSCAISGQCGTVLAPQLSHTHKIVELAKYLASIVSDSTTSILFTGLRPGDKLSETLCSSRGKVSYADVNGCMTLIEPSLDRDAQQSLLFKLKQTTARRDLAEALRLVCVLEPAYKPSDILLGTAQAGDNVAKTEHTR